MLNCLYVVLFIFAGGGCAPRIPLPAGGCAPGPLHPPALAGEQFLKKTFIFTSLIRYLYSLNNIVTTTIHSDLICGKLSHTQSDTLITDQS